MQTRTNQALRLTTIGAAAAALVLPLAACDREVSTEKESSTKIVDTPEGTKKVTETTETTTVKEKKDN